MLPGLGNDFEVYSVAVLIVALLWMMIFAAYHYLKLKPHPIINYSLWIASVLIAFRVVDTLMDADDIYDFWLGIEIMISSGVFLVWFRTMFER